MGSVGYKRPPTQNQFSKGKSGPSGRPKGASKANSLANVINTTVTVTVDGVARKMSLNKAMVMGLAQRGLAGSTPAAREFIKIADKIAEKAEQKRIEEVQHPYGVMPPISRFMVSGPDFEECSEPLRRPGVIQAVGKSYRIPTWVVEAALARKSRSQFSFNAEECQKIADNTENPEDWPPLLEKLEKVSICSAGC